MQLSCDNQATLSKHDKQKESITQLQRSQDETSYIETTLRQRTVIAKNFPNLCFTLFYRGFLDPSLRMSRAFWFYSGYLRDRCLVRRQRWQFSHGGG